MRTTDDPTPEKFQPFGPKVEKAKPEPIRQKPQGPYGVVVGEDGKMRTTKENLPKIEHWWDFGVLP